MERKKRTRKSKRIFFAWLRNTTDPRDDLPLKIRATNLGAAEDIARNHCYNRFVVLWVATYQQFKKWEPWWSTTLGPTKAVEF